VANQSNPKTLYFTTTSPIFKSKTLRLIVFVAKQTTTQLISNKTGQWSECFASERIAERTKRSRIDSVAQ